MKLSRPLVIQIAVWISIWLVFAFAGGPGGHPPKFYLFVTLRISLLVLFFNLVYYGLLPRYFAGKKRSFFSFSALIFIAYILLSILLELYVFNRPARSKPETEKPDQNGIPIMFLLIPPIVISLGVFGVAATSRGFAAFENKKKEEEEANRRRLEAEIALLKSQINPHFLLNTLNNLYALSMSEPEKTPEALFKLSELVSYILYECASPKVPLVRDLEFVEGYIALQKLRLPPNVLLTVHMPQDPPQELEIEPMVLIPFIENAFKHGITTKRHCELRIELKLTDYHLVLIVENDRFPPKEGQSGNPSGVGMVNTQQRLRHSYAGKHTLKIDEHDDKHRIELDLDLKP